MAGMTDKVGELFGRLRGAAKDVVEGYGGIFRRLAEEHGEVDAMMKRVSASEDAGTRKELFPKIRKEILAHARAEEKEFYPVLKEYNQTRELAERGMEEHKEVERMIEELHVSDPSEPAWGETFNRMMKAVETHVDMEENEIFPRAKDVLTREQIEEVDKRFEDARTAEMRTLG